MVSVRQQQAEPASGELIVGSPKSPAGTHTVAIPTAIIPALRDHLADFPGPEDDALIFTRARGSRVRRSDFRRADKWAETR